MTAHAHEKLTYEDYERLPEDGPRYELIDGELILNPSPITNHQHVALNIAFSLKGYVRQVDRGRVFAELDVVLSKSDVLRPDVCFVAGDSERIISPKNITGAPDLVVEVLSDGTRRRDEIDKRRLYERYGVVEYWVVDPELELVKIYRRNAANNYGRAVEVSMETGGAITSPLLPGFELPIADVFAAR